MKNCSKRRAGREHRQLRTRARSGPPRDACRLLRGGNVHHCRQQFSGQVRESCRVPAWHRPARSAPTSHSGTANATARGHRGGTGGRITGQAHGLGSLGGSIRYGPARGGWQLAYGPPGVGGVLKIAQEIIVGGKYKARSAGIQMYPGMPAGCARRCRSWHPASRPGRRCGWLPPHPRRAGCPPSPCFRQQHRPFAFGVGTDLGGRLGAFGARLSGDALTFRLHTREDRLGVLLRQVGAADTHVLDRHAKSLHLRVHPVADRRHDLVALGRQHVEQLVVGKHVAQRRRHHRIQPADDALLGRADRLVVQQRVDDAEQR